MPRPKKSSTDRRNKRIEIRLTGGEESMLACAAADAGLTVSDDIRKLALGIKPIRQMATPERAALIKGLAELGKVGSNINQIAKALNTEIAKGQKPVVGERISESLIAIQTLSTHLIKCLTNGH
jgi:hypothetical protein